MKLRQDRGLSQREVGGEELSASYVSLLEAGKREPTPQVLAVLAERLGTSMEHLRDGVEPSARRRVELEMRYAELARRSSEPAEARDRFAALVADPTTASIGVDRVALLGLAQCHEALGELEAAVRCYEDLARRIGDSPEDPMWWSAVNGTVICYGALGDLAHAADVGEAALAKAEERGHVVGELAIPVLSTVAGTQYQRGNLARAGWLLDRAMLAAERLGSREARGAAYWNASLVAHAHGRLDDALNLADRALAMYADGDNERARASLLEIQGWLLLRTDPPRPADARTLLRRARRLLAEVGSTVEVAGCETELARAELLLGDPATAAKLAGSALGRLASGDRLEAARARTVMAAAQHALGNEQAAEQAYRRAVADLRGCDASREAAAGWLELAQVCERTGQLAEALAAHHEAAAAVGLRGGPTTPVPRTAALGPAGAAGETAPETVDETAGEAADDLPAVDGPAQPTDQGLAADSAALAPAE